MKVVKLAVKNVTSYKNRTEFYFDKHLNILIGPNGGGKSNLQKILAVVLTKFFVQQYQVKTEQDRSLLEVVDPYNKRVLQSVLGTFNHQGGDQEIAIELSVDSSDIQNIESISQHLDDLNKALVDRFFYPV